MADLPERARRSPSNPRRDRDLAHLERLKAGEGMDEVERLRLLSPPQALLASIDQFNEGSFFEAHDTLERLWRKTWYPVRLFYQGLIKVAVGQEHMRRGNPTGAMSVSRGGVFLLQPFAPILFTVDVGLLVSSLDHFLRALEGEETKVPCLRMELRR